VGLGYQCKDVDVNRNISVKYCDEQKDFKWCLIKKSTDSALIKITFKDKNNGKETRRVSSGDFKDIQQGKNGKLKRHVCAKKCDE
jgi:hypothetical protein